MIKEKDVIKVMTALIGANNHSPASTTPLTHPSLGRFILLVLTAKSSSAGHKLP